MSDERFAYAEMMALKSRVESRRFFVFLFSWEPEGHPRGREGGGGPSG